MINNGGKYCSFSDESYASAERFRSISSFSFPTENLQHINDDLYKLLKNSSVSEFKWQKLRSAKFRFCAKQIIDYIINNVHKYKFRIDTIIWDSHDKRHPIINRDDLDNFGRMLFHLHKFLIEIRGLNSSWKLFYDVRDGIDWNKIKDCLLAVGDWNQVIDKPLFNKKIIIKNYNIESILPINSFDEPSCQVSDLFAGISVFSANKYDLFKQWQKQKSNQSAFLKKRKVITLEK